MRKCRIVVARTTTKYQHKEEPFFDVVDDAWAAQIKNSTPFFEEVKTVFFLSYFFTLINNIILLLFHHHLVVGRSVVIFFVLPLPLLL